MEKINDEVKTISVSADSLAVIDDYLKQSFGLADEKLKIAICDFLFNRTLSLHGLSALGYQRIVCKNGMSI